MIKMTIKPTSGFNLASGASKLSFLDFKHHESIKKVKKTGK